MEATQINIEKQTVFYTYGFTYNDEIYVFKSKNLFKIQGNLPPKLIQMSNNGTNGYWIGREFLTLNKIKELTKEINFELDISGIQWYIQEQIKLGEYF